jgi:pimeloyl-ACP methyl ester carboxylesterase
VLLETVLARWPVPVEELAMVAHSMGGLVARSACHYAAVARAEWPRHLRHLVFLGTPHHGAPLERGGQWLHRTLGVIPYARPLARLGSIRSAGITDLRHGNLLDEDWQDRDRFADARDRRRPVPLPATSCCAVAATRSPRPGPLHDRLVGDGLVPLDSALGRHRDPARSLPIPAEHQWVAHDTSHLGLLESRGAYLRIRDWLGG